MSIIGDMYEGGGSKPVKWTSVGQVIEGEVLSVQSKQLTTYGTERPECWPDGQPKLTPIVTVQTTLQEEADDDGRRDLYLRSGQFTAFRDALKEAFDRKPTDGDLIGAVIKMQFSSEAPSKYGNPRKVFRARITPRSTTGDAWDSEPPAGPETPPVDAYDDTPF